MENLKTFYRKGTLDPPARYLLLVIFAVGAVCPLAGCDSGLRTYPVTGTVHFEDGQPLAGGMIIFQSSDGQVQARSGVSRDGTFRVGTEEPGDGAVEGQHRVVVRALWQGPETPPKHPVHSKYRSPATSDLQYEVTRKGPNKFDIVIDRPERRK